MSIPNPSTTGTCLVTGASAGIGSEFARQMAERGYNVTLAARRLDRLTELAAEIERDHGVQAHAVECDVTDSASRAAMLDGIAGRGLDVDVLINNAGCGGEGVFADNALEDELREIELNITALTALSHEVVQGMLERGNGAILNVASTAAFQPIPRQSVYAATKSYVLSFSQSQTKELGPRGVVVSVLCPGPVRTEFFGERQAEIEADSPGWAWQSAEDCARDGIDGLFKHKRVIVPKAINRIGAVSGRHSPPGLTMEVLDRFWPIGK